MRKLSSLVAWMSAVALLAPFAAQASDFQTASTFNPADNIQYIAYIECGPVVNGEWEPQVAGSGVVVDENIVLTNAHVVVDDNYEWYELCLGGVATNSYQAPEMQFILSPITGNYNDEFDYALMRTYDGDGALYNFDSYVTLANADAMTFGEDLYALGYPGIGGSTITITEGSISGFNGTNWIKSDVLIEHGNSGGGAFDALGNLFAIPTGVAAGELGSISYLQNINAILEDAFGTGMIVRDYDMMYDVDNIFCFDDFCYNLAMDENTNEDIFGNSVEEADPADSPIDDYEEEDEAFDAGEDYLDEEESYEDDEPEDEEVVETPQAPTAGAYVPSKYDAALVARLKGYILLQTQEHGEAWYVNPTDSMRYYMPNGTSAYSMMRSMSLGITDADLAKLPSVASTDEMNKATSICTTNSLAKRLRGHILLQVQQHGEAWYVDPDTCRRIYMADGDAAYTIMRYLSLGILNSDLEKMPSGDM